MGKQKEKEIKTNAMRILDKNKISYEVLQYECDEFIDGIHTAQKTGAPVEQSFKTLIVQGKSKEYYVVVIPIALEIDLKKAAKAVGEKSVELIHVKDITKVSGYVRGGCSPLGMKKQYPTIIHESALAYEEIYVSGGRIGTTLKLNPKELAEIVSGKFVEIGARDIHIEVYPAFLHRKLNFEKIINGRSLSQYLREAAVPEW